MPRPESIIEIFLQPGECWFGDEHTRIRTLLGSCVAVTLWHPRLRLGGMCHYMLPTRTRPRGATESLDGRYADEALEILRAQVETAGTRLRDYQMKLFGGGRMFASSPNVVSVPERNIVSARALAAMYGMHISAEHLGGGGHRQIVFELWSGGVWVRHHEID